MRNECAILIAEEDSDWEQVFAEMESKGTTIVRVTREEAKESNLIFTIEALPELPELEKEMLEEVYIHPVNEPRQTLKAFNKSLQKHGRGNRNFNKPTKRFQRNR